MMIKVLLWLMLYHLCILMRLCYNRYVTIPSATNGKNISHYMFGNNISHYIFGNNFSQNVVIESTTNNQLQWQQHQPQWQ